MTGGGVAMIAPSAANASAGPRLAANPRLRFLKTTFVFPSGLASDGNTKETGVR